jgi:hypothetical protein
MKNAAKNIHFSGTLSCAYVCPLQEMLFCRLVHTAVSCYFAQQIRYKYFEERMSMGSIDFKRLNRQMMIYRIVQSVLTGLLIIMAIIFQGQFAALQKPGQFMSSIVAAMCVQLLLIYPVYRLAWRDAGVEIEDAVPNLTKEQQSALRKRRLSGDLWKFSVVVFFIAFVTIVPDAKKAAGAPLVFASTIFSFLLTCLMYFQCFNYSAKKRMKQVS